MFERYIILEKYVYTAMSECNNPLDILNREEIRILTDVLKVMKPIRGVITEISGDKYPICSIIIPIVHCLEKTISIVKSDTEAGKAFKNKVDESIKARFFNFEQWSRLAIGTILDPF